MDTVLVVLSDNLTDRQKQAFLTKIRMPAMKIQRIIRPRCTRAVNLIMNRLPAFPDQETDAMKVNISMTIIISIMKRTAMAPMMMIIFHGDAFGWRGISASLSGAGCCSWRMLFPVS